MLPKIESPYTNGFATLEKERRVRVFRNEDFIILEHYYKCTDTGREFTTSEIDELNINQVYNKYRSKYGLLFPDQIKSLREKYNLNHTEISKILGLGVNMIRNYENGEMPSLSNANLLSMIQIPEVFKDFFLMKKSTFGLKPEKEQIILSRVDQIIKEEQEKKENCLPVIKIPDEYTGYILPDFDKFAHMVIFFLERLDYLFKVKLNKLLFYADFYHFKVAGKSISGMKYVAIPKGPVPDKYSHLYATMVDKGILELTQVPSKEFHQALEKLVPSIKFNEEIFSTAELSTLSNVFKALGYKPTEEIISISHNELCWKELNELTGVISYSEYAFDLKELETFI